MIDKELRSVAKVFAHSLDIFGGIRMLLGCKYIVQRGEHVAKPNVARALIDDEIPVPKPQTWMPSFKLVGVRAAKVLHEEQQ